MNIAIIPARGGSKRIPRKNIKRFHGKPIIAYSIEAALASGCFDKVIVSTEDLEIAAIAQQYGAETPFIRPAKIADDYATTLDVMQHAVAWCEKNQIFATHFCCIYATAPFITAPLLQQGLALLQKEDCEFTFCATTFAAPIQRAFRRTKDGSIVLLDDMHEKTRSQDLDIVYHDAGQFYFGKKNAFLQKKAIFASHSKAIIIPRNRIQDIDNQEDWDFAEALFTALGNMNENNNSN